MKELIVTVEQKSFTGNLRICEEARGWKLQWDVESKDHGGCFDAGYVLRRKRSSWVCEKEQWTRKGRR